jgi:hypothetical protein
VNSVPIVRRFPVGQRGQVRYGPPRDREGLDVEVYTSTAVAEYRPTDSGGVDVLGPFIWAVSKNESLHLTRYEAEALRDRLDAWLQDTRPGRGDGVEG